MGNVITKSMEFSRRNMFDNNMVFTYEMICEKGATYEEFMKALSCIKDRENDIEDVVEQPNNIPAYKFKDGREIKFVLKNTEVEENNMRWIIEWYEGYWTDTEPAEKKKKGFIHREVFYDVFAYTSRLRELEMNDDYSPIIVGTYECEIVNKHPEEASL